MWLQHLVFRTKELTGLPESELAHILQTSRTILQGTSVWVDRNADGVGRPLQVQGLKLTASILGGRQDLKGLGWSCMVAEGMYLWDLWGYTCGWIKHHVYLHTDQLCRLRKAKINILHTGQGREDLFLLQRSFHALL